MCSGGQQRRISFAVALLHKPRLLILDEPTVGVDLVLRQSIWNHLKELVKTQNTTIIITTHYIAEAHDADMIALMRDGRVLLQDSPENALRKYSCTRLDDVVLKVCLNDNIASQNPELDLTNVSHQIVQSPIAYSKLPKQKEHLQFDTVKLRLSSSLNRLKALVTKNFISLWRQFLFVFILLFLPAIQLAICCLAIGRDPFGLTLGVVNQENTSNNFTQDDCLSNLSEMLSCRFIQKMEAQESIKLKHFENEHEAMYEANRGDIWGYFVFGANFTQQLVQRQLDGVYAENQTIDESLVRVHLDMSNYQIAISLQKVFFEAFNKFSIELLEEAGNNPKTADLPISFEEPIFGNKHLEFTEFLAPGTLLSLIFFMAVSLTGVVYITEKKSGLMERLLVSGVTPFEIIMSHVISQYAIMIFQTVITLVILIMVFNVQIHGPLGGVILLVILQGTLGMFFGFMLSTVCNDEKTVMQMTQAFFMPSFVLSGIIWPVESMPTVMRYISMFMPQTFASDSIRSMITRGWPIFHSMVWPGFAVTIAWITVFWFITMIFAKR